MGQKSMNTAENLSPFSYAYLGFTLNQGKYWDLYALTAVPLKVR
jgi:hypothetical protein